MQGKAKPQPLGQRAHGLFGSLKDALAAASRDDNAEALRSLSEKAVAPVPAVVAIANVPVSVDRARVPAAAGHMEVESVMVSRASDKEGPQDGVPAPVPSAEEAARAVRGSISLKPQEPGVELDEPPTTRVVRKPVEAKSAVEVTDEPARTQLVRGRQKLERTSFAQDPVVGWLVVVGGPGLGSFRPIFEGNNTLGRSKSQRIAIDFGDDAISSEEQAYIRYDSTDRGFLFVPNLAKTNVVSVNDKRPTGAVELAHMDVITVGRTQLVFVPFCGPDFDWAELAEVKD